MFALLKNFRVSIKDNTSAYGYSIAITGITSMMNSANGKATPVDLVAGAGGAVFSYMLVELLAVTFLRKMSDDDGVQTRLLARMLSLLSVGGALGCAFVIAKLMTGWQAWFLAGFVGTTAFVVLEGVELYIADDLTGSE